MGPSGAGKSTLLNILSGYKTTKIEGSITMNGKERNISVFRKLSAYIMQDNQLHANLTVEEAMNVAANLKLSQKVQRSEKMNVIKSILDTLGLEEHRRTLTRNLSGGQKKRMSIALELVNNPPVSDYKTKVMLIIKLFFFLKKIMFFDEPTSGLDSSTCFQCINLLKFLARGGRTIICTIHQPSARLFEMFDQLYTLSEGQCVYQGSTKQLVPFLATLGLECQAYHNPASYIIEVACGEHGDHTRKLVNAIENGKKDIRTEDDYEKVKAINGKNDIPKVHTTEANLKSTYEKNDKFSDNINGTSKALIPAKIVNDIMKGGNDENAVSINVDDKEPDTTTALLSEESGDLSPERYPTSEFHQFWVVLKRTLLFSRRDWTLMYLRLFAHVLVGFLIGALYYDIGNDGAKVLSNLGFLFFNMLFLMYTSMTITILSCKIFDRFLIHLKKNYFILFYHVVPLEMPVLLKENFNRWYSLRSYYLAITISDIPFQVCTILKFLKSN
ncbi:hypothetical protein ACKWTF_002180 [Chironomus riparius]